MKTTRLFLFFFLVEFVLAASLLHAQSGGINFDQKFGVPGQHALYQDIPSVTCSQDLKQDFPWQQNKLKCDKEPLYHPDSVFFSYSPSDIRWYFTYDDAGKTLTEIEQRWLESMWKNFWMKIYSYDGSGNLINVVVKTGGNNTWGNYWNYSYTYDAGGHMLTWLRQYWQNNAWVNDMFYIYAYDANGNRLTWLWQNWDNNAWLNMVLHTYSYDTQGNMLTDLHQVWNNNTWENGDLLTWTYDAGGNLLTELEQEWQINAWINDNLITYTYYIGANVVNEILQDFQDSTWVNVTFNAYTYDGGGNLLSRLFLEWKDGAWFNDYLSIYTYDASGNRLTELGQTWENNMWTNHVKVDFAYLGTYIEANGYGWDGIQWILTDLSLHFTYMGDKLFDGLGYFGKVFFSSITTGIPGTLAASNNTPVVFPNPAGSQVSLTLDQSLKGRGSISVSDLSGRQVMVVFGGDLGSLSSPVTFDVSNLKEGLYLLVVQTKDAVMQQKLVVVK